MRRNARDAAAHAVFQRMSRVSLYRAGVAADAVLAALGIPPDMPADDVREYFSLINDLGQCCADEEATDA